jgi:hypothetical protein
MNRSPDPTPAPPLTFTLWVGIFAGPAAWLLNQQINYLLVYQAREAGTPFGLHLVTLACATFTAASAAGCGVRWRDARASLTKHQDAAWRRVMFMAGLGALTSLLFLVAIIAFSLPPLFLHPRLQ